MSLVHYFLVPYIVVIMICGPFILPWFRRRQ